MKDDVEEVVVTRYRITAPSGNIMTFNTREAAEDALLHGRLEQFFEDHLPWEEYGSLEGPDPDDIAHAIRTYMAAFRVALDTDSV